MNQVTIYAADASDFTDNGLGVLEPSSCVVNEIAGGMYELELEHPMDDAGRWMRLQDNRILKAPTPVRDAPIIYTLEEGLTYNIYSVEEKTYIRATANGKKLGKLAKKDKLTQVGESVVQGSKTWVFVTSANTGLTGYVLEKYLEQTGTYYTTDGLDAADVAELKPARDQLFRIYKIELDTDKSTVKAYARHIFYDLEGCIVNGGWTVNDDNEVVYVGDFSNTDTDPATVFALIGTAVKPTPSEMGFRLHGAPGGGTASDHNYSFENMVKLLLDESSGVVPLSGWQMIRDGYDVYFLPKESMGDTELTIRRGKNLIGLEVETDYSDTITRIVPVGSDSATEDYSLPLGLECDSVLEYDAANEKYLPSITPLPGGRTASETYLPFLALRFDKSVNAEGCPFIRVKQSKCNADYDGEGEEDDKYATAAEARAAMLQEVIDGELANGEDAPKISVDVDFVQLQDTDEYKQYSGLQAVHLYDKVRVIDELAGFDNVMRVSEYEWDVLAGQYSKIKLER